MIIVITGTCAVGKSTISKQLCKSIKGKTHRIEVDRERFNGKYSSISFLGLSFTSKHIPHLFSKASKANKVCVKKARNYEQRECVVVVEGNYLYPDFRRIYDNAQHIHLDANLSTILHRHRNREKQHSLGMIISSWFGNKIIFRRGIQTDRLNEKEVVDIILRRVYKEK